MSEIVEACIDKMIPLELEELARDLAVRTNPANAPRPGRPFELAADVRYLWRPGSVLDVRFLGGDPLVHLKVEMVAHQWEEFANVRFNFSQAPNAPIRIAFDRSDGSWSYLGTQALVFEGPDAPTMNFGWLEPESGDEIYTRVVLHEFGHALGCIHEHQHPEHGIPWDKEKAYAYYGRQGWSRQEVDTQVFRRYAASVSQFSKFDTQSIMLYPIPASITTGGFAVGWNRVLSNTDKQFIGTLYPFETAVDEPAPQP